MYQPLIKFHPYPAIITQVLVIFVFTTQNSDTYGNEKTTDRHQRLQENDR